MWILVFRTFSQLVIRAVRFNWSLNWFPHKANAMLFWLRKGGGCFNINSIYISTNFERQPRPKANPLGPANIAGRASRMVDGGWGTAHTYMS